MYDANAIPTVRAILELRPLREKRTLGVSSGDIRPRRKAAETRRTRRDSQARPCGHQSAVRQCMLEGGHPSRSAVYISCQLLRVPRRNRGTSMTGSRANQQRRHTPSTGRVTTRGLVCTIAMDIPVLGARRQTTRRAVPARGLGGPRGPLRLDRACPRD